ncbi:MAG: peptidoglycan bridge formation glycyltransferase FemA/FemB family protein [Candidatus Saccharibacteria bacterium]|nr:peptidoglycan bridge formation glycyltransferase FemA/FemB family protein [Candidatus Saccharibacteria bacterium]
MRETNFLQSPAWADFQRKCNHEVIEKQTDSYNYLAIVEKGQLSNRLYCPLGPVVDDLTALQEALSDLKVEAKRRKLDFIRIEPTLTPLTTTDLTKLGLKHSSRDVQPPHSVVNDVSAEPEDILAQLSQTARRYARKCDKAGITYSVSYDPADIKYYIELIHEVAERTGMKPHDDFYFQQIAGFMFPKKTAGLLFAELDGQKIAAIIFYTDSKTMLYAHAANSTEYRKFSPATGLGQYALQFAHDQGCQVFDWCGVAPATDDGNPRWKAWAGFTQFKLSYGGERVDRLGAWELPVRKFRYRIYRLLLALTGR